MCLIIDKLKSGVTKPDREEPHLNATFREFALHYGLATLPATTRQISRDRWGGRRNWTRIGGHR